MFDSLPRMCDALSSISALQRGKREGRGREGRERGGERRDRAWQLGLDSNGEHLLKLRRAASATKARVQL